MSIFDQPTDQDALDLAHSIALQESGQNGKPNYSAVGDAGTSHGAYQWQPGNFEAGAKEAGLDPKDFSPTNQDKVAYYQVLKDKQAGLDPGQIASKWNSGSPDNWKDHSGVTTINGKQIHYDTPAYVKGVQKYYQQMKGSSGQSYPTNKLEIPSGVSTVSSPNQNSVTADNSFIGDASNTIGQTGTGVGNAVNQTLSGQINPLSGLIQGAGAIAGGISGLVGNVAEHLPVIGGAVKGAEGLAGQAIGAAANTEVGKQVVGGIQNFAQAHPELAGDIGGVANIAGLVGGGVGGVAGKTLLKEGIYNAAKEGLIGAGAKGLVEKKALSDAAEILGSKATKAEVKSAVRSGRTTVQGGVPGILDDKLKNDSVKEVSNLVKSGEVSKKALAADNANAIKSAADTEAESMRSQLRSQEIQKTLQPEDLQNLAQKVIQRAGESASSGEKPAETLLKVFTDNLPKGRDITAEDVLDARQAVSNFVLQNRQDWNMRGVLTGFKSARNAFWDESRTLLKSLAPGVDVGGSLAKQSALYRALDYIVPNVQKEIGTTRIGRFVKRHPYTAGLIKTGLRYGAMGAGLKGAEHLIP